MHSLPYTTCFSLREATLGKYELCTVWILLWWPEAACGEDDYRAGEG